MSDSGFDLNGKEVLGLVESSKNGDSKALSRLVVLLTPVVRAQAKRIYLNKSLERDDLFQEGMFGVFEAVEKFDASRGASFLTFVNLCVRSKMLTAVGGSGGDSAEGDAIELADSDSKQNAYCELIDFINSSLTELERLTLKTYLSGYSYRETASKLHTTVKAVDGTLQRVRRKLMNYYD